MRSLSYDTKTWTMVLLSSLALNACHDKNPNPLSTLFFGERGSRDSVFFGVNVRLSRCLLVSDNNRDGHINPGEMIYLRIYLRNLGTEPASYVKTTFGITSPYVTDINPTTLTLYETLAPGGDEKAVYYGTTTGNSGLNEQYTVRFKVSNSMPVGSEIKLTMEVVDPKSNRPSEPLSFYVEKTGASIEFSRYLVLSDNNKDGNVNPGETAYLRVHLRNKGTSQANDVSASIGTASAHVTDMAPRSSFLSFGTLQPNGGEGYAYYGTITSNDGFSEQYTVRFTLSTTVAIGAVIPFAINIKDAENNTWTDAFAVTVQQTGAVVSFSRYQVISDNNKDGAINAGETIYLRVHLKNTGTSQANNVSASLATTSGYISNSLSTAVTYGTIASGGGEAFGSYGSIYGNNGFTEAYTTWFIVSSNAPSGTAITFSLNIRDAELNTWTDSFSISIK